MANSIEQDRSIEQLKQRYEKLNERKIQTKTKLESAESELRKLQQEAEAEFGTSDVSKLQTQLNELEKKNEASLKEYQKLLDKIETDLKKVEQTANDPAPSETAPDE